MHNVLIHAICWFTPDRIIALATVTYAGVTIVMFFTIRSQTKATHRQADIAERATEAAEKSADTLVGSERAWVLVELRANLHDDGEGGGYIFHQTTRTGNSPAIEKTVLYLKVCCKNEGKSPAWIDKVYGQVKIVSKSSNRYRPSEQDCKDFGHIGPLGVNQPISHPVILECLGHESGGEDLSVFVAIKYRDIFGKIRESTAGYNVGYKTGIERDGIPERTRYT